METTMTAIIVAAQGYGLADRTKTCARASTKAKVVPLELVVGPSENFKPCFASGESEAAILTNNNAAGLLGGITGTGTTQNNNRPNRVLQDCRTHGGAADQWWNPAAFTLDNYQVGTLGNSGVGSCLGPGLANTDFSIYKNFKATERVTLQFRFEFFNLFNKTQFRTDSIDTNINTNAVACTEANIDTPPCAGHALNTLSWSFAANGNANNFGLVRNDKGPREIQYALKINF